MTTRAWVAKSSRRVIARLLVVCWMGMAIACGGCGGKNPASSKPQDLILGKWTWTGSLQGKVITITNDFGKDGVVKLVQDGVLMEVSYKFVGDDQIDYGVYGRSKIVSITKDKLDILGNDGVRRTWTRP